MDRFTLMYGLAFALLIGVETGRIDVGLGLLLLNGAVALAALIVLPILRHRGKVARFFGVTLPLLVFYLYYRETSLALELPNVVWLDRQVAFAEMAYWETIAPVSHSALLGEVFALAYMSYVPMLLVVAGVMLGRPGGPVHPAETMVRRICISWGICFVVFVMVPVLGPRLLFPDFQGFRIGHGPFTAIAQFNQHEGMLHGAAFPSAHLAATIVATVSAWWRRALFWSILPVSISIAAGAVYLGYHYVTDVVAGTLVGLAAMAVDQMVVGRRRQPESPALEEPAS